MSQWDLAHINYVRSLKASLTQEKIMVSTLDYRTCKFYQWYQSASFLDESIKEILFEINPLHQRLHNYAGQISKFIQENKSNRAKQTWNLAEKDLETLGRYLAGLRTLTFNNQLIAMRDFTIQTEEMNRIYRQAVQAANRLENYLQKEKLSLSLQNMNRTVSRSTTFIWLCALTGFGLSLVVGTYTTKVIRKAMETLEKTYEELKELDKLKTNFLSTVSHELRTPLTSVLGFAAIVKKKLEETIFPKIANDQENCVFH